MPKPKSRKVPAITPIDIKNRQFKGKLFGGYDKEDVRTFLEQVANELNNLIQINKELEAQLTQMRVKLLESEELKTDYEKLQDRMLIMEGELDAYKKENEALKSRIQELEAELENLRKELEEKEEALSALSQERKESPDEIIDLAVSAAEKIKFKALEELENAFKTLPPSFKPMVSEIIDKIRRQIEG